MKPWIQIPLLILLEDLLRFFMFGSKGASLVKIPLRAFLIEEKTGSLSGALAELMYRHRALAGIRFPLNHTASWYCVVLCPPPHCEAESSKQPSELTVILPLCSRISGLGKIGNYLGPE